MDVLYPLGTGSLYRNYELRLSLRSLRHIDHDRVFIIGSHELKWLQRLTFIKYPDVKKFKQLSVINKILFMCRPESELSEDFILMNDDFYFLQKQAVKSFCGFQSLPELRIKYPDSSYGRAIETTIMLLISRKLPDVNYEIHYPIILNKTKFRDLFSSINLQSGPVVYRSIYGNTYSLSAEPTIDFKIYNYMDFYKKKDAFFISTDTIIPELYNFKRFMLERVGDRSVYEAAMRFGNY
jgi:hypothetical protein